RRSMAHRASRSVVAASGPLPRTGLPSAQRSSTSSSTGFVAPQGARSLPASSTRSRRDRTPRGAASRSRSASLAAAGWLLPGSRSTTIAPARWASASCPWKRSTSSSEPSAAYSGAFANVSAGTRACPRAWALSPRASRRSSSRVAGLCASSICALLRFPLGPDPGDFGREQFRVQLELVAGQKLPAIFRDHMPLHLQQRPVAEQLDVAVEDAGQGALGGVGGGQHQLQPERAQVVGGGAGVLGIDLVAELVEHDHAQSALQSFALAVGCGERGTRDHVQRGAVLAAGAGAHALAQGADDLLLLPDHHLEVEEAAVVIERGWLAGLAGCAVLDDVAEGGGQLAGTAEERVALAHVGGALDEVVQGLQLGRDLVPELVALVVGERRAALQGAVERGDLVLQAGEVVVQRRGDIGAEGLHRGGVGLLGGGLVLHQLGVLELGDLLFQQRVRGAPLVRLQLERQCVVTGVLGQARPGFRQLGGQGALGGGGAFVAVVQARAGLWEALVQFLAVPLDQVGVDVFVAEGVHRGAG